MENTLNSEPPKKKNWLWPILIIIVILIACGVFLFVRKDSDKSETANSVSGSKSVEISAKVLANKFGWLGGDSDDDGAGIVEDGGAWVRPHPGPFLWDSMQYKETAEIDFSIADATVANYSKNSVAVLATIFPFATWDQAKRANATDCQVKTDDEFLRSNDKKGRGFYLPQFRCNPNDWVAYKNWVTKTVERYDGDGVDDMPGLTIPIKYWEVMNEPDLNYGNDNPPPDSGSSLNFYMQGPDEYEDLLIKTNEAIKAADTEAKVLIAGAVGADPRMLNFYRQVLTNPATLTAFDIGNVHCISNDRQTHDFNVNAYKQMLAGAGVPPKSIWVTEAEAMYGSAAEENYQNTTTSTKNAISAGAEKIFFTRNQFDDFRTDMSTKGSSGNAYPSAEKFRELIESLSS